MKGETESHIFPINPCKVWHLERENGLQKIVPPLELPSKFSLNSSSKPLMSQHTFAVEHLHNQPQTSQAGNDMSGGWKSSSTFLLPQPSFSYHGPFQPPEGKTKEQKDQARPQALTPWRRAVLDSRVGSRDSVCTGGLHRQPSAE